MNCWIILRLFTTLVLVLLYVSFEVKGQSANALIGNWTLTTITDKSGRDVSFFKNEKGVLVGRYTTFTQETKEISNIRVSRGVYYFEVPDLQFYFQMKRTREGFQGTMSAYSTTEKRVPEPAKMVRRTNSR